MPNKRINQLNPNLDPLTGNELIPIFDTSTNTTERITLTTLANFVDSTTDTFVTGFTYNNNNTFSIYDNSGGIFQATFDEVTGLTINGNLVVTGNTVVQNLTASTVNNVQYIDFDVTQSGTTSIPGRLYWDTSNQTLSLGMIGGPVQQIGQEQYYLVENQTGSVLNDGTVVRAIGTTGNSGKLTIDYMIANNTIPAFTTLGVLTEQLNNGETGYVTNFGLVRGIDTTGAPYGESWSQGDVLYVSTTALGGFTKFKPVVPNQDIIVALVMEVGLSGSIFVRPDIYRPFKDPNRITVAKQNGDFTSVKDAVDSITTSSSSNRYVIDVGPGEFYEDEIDLTTKPYISIVGSNIQTTLIIPNTNSQHIIKIGINNEISFLSLSGAAVGYAGIYAYDIGDFGQAHKLSFYDCDTSIWVESDTQDTKFYGEYIDYNGEYSYGTRVVANNGYLALANMENYFNFPTGTGITYCNYATGSGATINSFVGDSVSNGISGSTVFFIQDSAELNASSITSGGFTYGIRNPNIGNPVRFNVDNTSFVNGEWDLYIERNGTFGTFGGSSSHEKIFTNSPDIYWLFLDIDDGELDITRKASVTFSDGSHTDFTTLIFEGGSMGLMSGGSLTTISGTTIQADGGFGYLEKSDNSGIVRRLDWSNTLVTLSANTNNYVFINENSNLGVSGSRPNSEYNIILGRVVTNTTDVEFIDLTPFNAEHTSNKYNNLFSEAIGPIYALGSITTEGTTPFTLDVTGGEYYFSTNKILPTGGTGITFTQYYRNGTGSTWVTSATTVVNNTQYDNNGTLTGLTTGYYTKHTLYVVGENSYENYFLVLGQNEYPTLVQTENALLPTPPSYFTDSVTQIANIYIKQGTTGITQIEDIRPVIGFRTGGVNASSVHGNLLGLSSDDHTQYLLVNGGRPMSGNLNMGGNNITNVNLVDGVGVSSHAIRHKFGGLDPVGTTTPTANAIPYADVSGKLDSWITPVTISGGTGITTGGSYPNFTITNNSPATSVTLTNAGGTVSLVNDGNGPSLATKGLVAGTGVSLTDGGTQVTITNTAPDQTVVLSAGTGISTSGTYPNFTITNNDPASNVSLTSAGGTISLVNDGTGPSLANKGLVAGTGVSLTDGGTQVTITNNDPASSVTLTSAGGTVSLVNDGTGPSLANKGLVAGTGISFTDTATQVTITNNDPASSVTLTNAGGTVSLVNDGTGPSLATKGLVAGTGISLTDSGTQVTITNTGSSPVAGTLSTVQLALSELFATATGSIGVAGITTTFLPFLSYVGQGSGGGGTLNTRWQFTVPVGYLGSGSIHFRTRRSTAVVSALVSVFIDGVLSNINGTQSINPVALNTWELFSINLTTAATPGQTITVLAAITLGNGQTYYFRDAYFNY